MKTASKPLFFLLICLLSANTGESRAKAEFPETKISISGNRWLVNGRPTNAGSRAEGLLMNVRMVNAVFEDEKKPEFDANANTKGLIDQLDDYRHHGVNAITISLQGGMPGYEKAVNSAFRKDGSLKPAYMNRVERLTRACDSRGMMVILGCFYQRQDQILADDDAVRKAVSNVTGWIIEKKFGNIILEIANEFDHGGFNHRLIGSEAGQRELIRLAKSTAPGLLVSTSGSSHGRFPENLATEVDFLLIHYNNTKLDEIAGRIAALKRFQKPIVCNDDVKIGEEGARAAEISVNHGASWGLMLEKTNQHFPFQFQGHADDPVVYDRLKTLTTPEKPLKGYFPRPESQGGWRMLTDPKEIRELAGMDPEKLEALRAWLRNSDNRDFAAVVIRNGYVVLQEERGNSAVSDSRRVASCSKAICATVLAIASEKSLAGTLPRRMTFDDNAFDYLPWAQPLSDPRKAKITVKQLLNHTSGICPEATGAPNSGSWEYIFGLSGDKRTAVLNFEPGTACGYSTHALAHAAMVCENVTGQPYEQFAMENLFRPLGLEHWSFEYFNGGPKIGRHASHGLGMSARDMARIAYCMANRGQWQGKQIIPRWFVEETARASHNVTGSELRFKINAQAFSHGWELPAMHDGVNSGGKTPIPADARYKPGSGGQLMAFVPSLGLVITRQTGSSGQWDYAEYLKKACEAVITEGK